MLDAGRQEDKIVLAHDVVLAGDLHQPLAFEHVIDLLLNLMLVPRDMRHRLVHRNPVVEVTRARGLRHHQRLRQRAAKMVGEFAPGHFGDIADEGAVFFESHCLESPCHLAFYRAATNSTASRPGNFSKHQRAQHRHRIRRRAVKMPGGFAGGIKPGDRPSLAQDFGLLSGREPAESVGDGADQGISEIGRLGRSGAPNSISAAVKVPPPPAHRNASRRTAQCRRLRRH